MHIERFSLFSRLAASAFVSFSLAVPPVLSSELAGEAVNVRPNASLKNGEGRVSLQVGMDVHMGDVVRTNSRGEAQLIFTDDTKLVVGPKSSLVIESYLLRSKNRANNFTVKALSGTFRMVSGKSQKSAYKIKTPTATIGIRGTTFDMAVNRRRTDLFMYTGSAEFCAQLGCINVEPSCTIARASRFRGARNLENERDVIDSVARGFPYLGDDERLQAGFRARPTGCSDETISRITRAARARNRGRPAREMHGNDVDPEVREAPERSGPPSDPDPPDSDPF